MAGAPIPKKKITLNVYLLKKNTAPSSNGLWTAQDFIASPVGKSGRSKRIATQHFALGAHGELGTLYIRSPIQKIEPEWLVFVKRGMADPTPLERLKNQSVSALLVVENRGRQFAIAFGHGRYMIDSHLIEERFGIRVVLNSIAPDKIASIDRQTFDASPRISRTQTIKASSVSDYMISAEQDLLRGLVGFTKPKYAKSLGHVLAGIDSLKSSVGIDISELDGFLSVALERSLSRDYLAPDAIGNSSEFAWVDNLRPVTDKSTIEDLEKQLWKKLSAKDFSEMWLAVPDIVDWSEITGFSYGKQVPDNEDDVETALDLAAFLATLRSGATMQTFKHRNILMLMANGTPPRPLNAFKCLYAEIKDKVGLFILNVGTWFRVEPKFQTDVEKYFTALPRKPFAVPFMPYAHAGEGPYNDAVCSSSPTTHAILDRKLVRFGGSHDKIEVCDIYKPAARKGDRIEFIHVKRGRSSSTLSHLFAQGLVASTLLVKEDKFLGQVNKQLTKQTFPQLQTGFTGHGSDVVYAIIDGPAGATLDLPFFSKVTLQNCGKSIAAFGYRVLILHIPESAAQLATVAAKKMVKKAAKKAAAAPAKKTKSGKP